MAFYTDTHSRDAGLRGRIAHFISEALAAQAKRTTRRRVARATFNELAMLSDRELADLGIARGNIRRIALEAAAKAV